MLAIGILSACLAMAAESPRDWATLHEARLELAIGQPDRAESLLGSLLGELDALDPLRAETAYWLAQARFALEDDEAALQVLALARQEPATRERATALHARWLAMTRLIKELPSSFSLEDSPGPFVHSWLHGERGSLEVDVSPGGGGHAIRWTSRVRERQDDQLTASFSGDAGDLVGIRMTLQAEGFPVFLRVLAVDYRDREFATEPFSVVPGSPLPLDLELSSFHSTDPTMPHLAPSPRVRHVHVHDVTAWLSADRGPRTVWIDDIEFW